MLGRREQVGYLEDRCGRLAHSGSTFTRHLLGTEAILARWGCAPSVRRAGLFHSIYGTDPSKSPPVKLDGRPEVRRAIGPRAELLAYLFCAAPRRSLFEGLDPGGGAGRTVTLPDRFTGERRAVTARTHADLLAIEVANWLEQRPRHGQEREADWGEEFRLALPHLPAAVRGDLEAAYGHRE